MDKQITKYNLEKDATFIEKPILLFAGAQYYPNGGWGDFVGAFRSLEGALEAAANTKCDWWHIISIFQPEKNVMSGSR